MALVLLDALLRAHITNDWNDLAINVLTMCLDDGVELLLGAADNVDLGSVDGERLSNLRRQVSAVGGS